MEFKVFSKFFFSNSNYTQKLRNKEEGDPEEFNETMKKKKPQEAINLYFHDKVEYILLGPAEE